jgi:uncharacterized OB-fold protein
MRTALALFACLLLTFTAGAIAAPGTAYACSCAAPPSVEDELSRKTAIFSGTVTKVIKPDNGIIDSSIDRVEVTFDVENVWKGELTKQAKVYTAIGSESCGYVQFKEGGRYLVSAYGTPERLETGMCELTKPIDEAGDALEQLGAGYEPAEGSKPGSVSAEGSGPGSGSVEGSSPGRQLAEEGVPGSEAAEGGASVWAWIGLVAAVGIGALIFVRTRSKHKGGGQR